MEREKTFVSAVVYMRNAAQDAADFIRSVGQSLDDTFENYEIIAVDDCSFDHTAEALRSAKGNLRGALTVVELSFQQGVQRALNAGIDLAIGDFVYEFESPLVDFQPDVLLKAYKTALDGSDIVSAVPDVPQRLSSRMFYRLFNKHSGSHYPLVTDRFRLVSRRAINRVSAMSHTVTYRKAFYMSCGLKSAYISFSPVGGSSVRSDARQRQSLAMDSLILFTGVFYRLSFILSMLMMAFSVFLGGYTLFVYFSANPIEGWTTTLLVLAFSFFGLFLILTIVLKYLSLMLGLQFNKREYAIERINKI